MRTIMLLSFLLVIAGCATTYTMKNCKAKDYPFSECEKP